ncbi:5562_t:CDS:1, partial [Racocetra persica]
KVERVGNIPHNDSFGFADGFDIVHILITDLIDKNSAKREAKALRYIYSDHLICILKILMYIQVTRLLSGWKVTSLSNAGTDFATSRVVTQHYNWEEYR